MAGDREGVAAIEVQRDRDGRSWVSVDCLVDLFAGMADSMEDGPAKRNLLKVADTFRPLSMYAGVEAATADDGSTMQARRCSCGALVIAGKRLSGDAVTVDAEPVAEGALVPVRIEAGIPVIGPWNGGLDGLELIRLAEHVCEAVS